MLRNAELSQQISSINSSNATEQDSLQQCINDKDIQMESLHQVIKDKEFQMTELHERLHSVETQIETYKSNEKQSADTDVAVTHLQQTVESLEEQLSDKNKVCNVYSNIISYTGNYIY